MNNNPPPPLPAPSMPGLAMILDHSNGDETDQFIFGSGWALPEGHCRWAIGHQSDIIIRPGIWMPGAVYGRIFALIEAAPFLGLDLGNPQRIGIHLNGQFLREVSLGRTGVIGFWIPASMIGQPLMISLSHPGARVPSAFGMSDDHRPLAFSLHRFQLWNIPESSGNIRSGLADAMRPADILAHFESLGDNCEFGLVQRHAGIEPLGLFRFTATPFASLVDGLLHEFAGLGDADAICVDVRGDVREYILTETRWNLTYHTFAFANDMPADRVIHREAQKLTLLKRRMLDDLRSARRIYLVKHNVGLDEEDIMALFLLLNRFAPNRLLCVSPSSPDHPANSFQQLTNGVISAHIERFAPYDAAGDFSADAWLAVCSQALDLFQTCASQVPAYPAVALA